MAADLPAYFAKWRASPTSMVRDLFGAEPDAWQLDVLNAFPTTKRIVMPSAKGPGKSTILAWLAWNFLLTRQTPKVAATSISGDNLRDGLWTEMAKWQQKCPLLQQLFEWTTTRIFAKENPEQWWMSARTWPQSGDSNQQANTLAGLHADHILFLIDESGGMTDAVMVAAEAALSSCKEGHIVQAGNPTQLSGPLYRAWRNEHGLWMVVPVTGDPDDPKRSPRIDVEWAKQMIKEYGRDNVWVRTNVFGEFPQAAFNSLISADDVRAAMKRYYRPYEIGKPARIMGGDIARFGDDSSVLARREGRQMYPFKKYRGLDGHALGSLFVREQREWSADALFVDDTGGFGASVIDYMKALGHAPVGIHFAASARDKARYENRRAEMYFEFANWIRDGGALPDDDDLFRQLIATTYTIKKDAMQIAPKELIKKKLQGRSPDEADAAVLTFADPVAPTAALRSTGRHTFFWEPFGEVDNKRQTEYDPYGGGSA